MIDVFRRLLASPFTVFQKKVVAASSRKGLNTTWYSWYFLTGALQLAATFARTANI